MTAAITMENLSVAYRGRMALRNVSLSVAAGECVGVFGHNGAGKSTLLRTLLGLARPVDGRVFVLGVPLERSYLRGLRTRIGYVPQAHAVDPRLPVRVQEAVLSGRCGRLGPLRVPGVEDHDAVRRALARTGLARMANRPFGQLSGGEQQRVLLARALAQDPDLLLLDEPTSSLDRDFRRRLCEILRQTHRKCGLTTLVVSHDEETLSLLCDRILLLDGGQVTGEMSAPTFSQWCEREAVAVP